MKLDKKNPEITKHIQKIQLMILKDFIEICERYEIPYFIYAGTLLGAIRHGGYIPWDDDTDVCMLRKDFEKFQKMFKPTEKYQLISIDLEENYPFPFAKFMLKDTICEEKWMRNADLKLGFNIDIFPLDDVSNNKGKAYYQLKRCFLYNRLIIFSKTTLPYTKLLFISSWIINKILRVLNITPQKMHKKCLNFLKKYEDDSCEKVFDISAGGHEYPLIYSKHNFTKAKKIMFEDLEVNMPQDYDEILTELYGDYMTPLPIEEREAHDFEFIDFGEY